MPLIRNISRPKKCGKRLLTSKKKVKQENFQLGITKVIQRFRACAACSSNGPKYDLILNTHRMAHKPPLAPIPWEFLPSYNLCRYLHVHTWIYSICYNSICPNHNP